MGGSVVLGADRAGDGRNYRVDRGGTSSILEGEAQGVSR